MQKGFLRIPRIIAISFMVVASTASASGGANLEKFIVPDQLKDWLESFEPSATIYAADLGIYLIASDNTTDDDKPWLFQFDPANNRLSPWPINIEGARPLGDMESLSQQGNMIHIMSSQGVTTFGKEKTVRNQFIRARRDGRRIQMIDQIELRPMLIAALERSADPDLRALRGRYHGSLDVESHFIMDGNLYLGLKNPQPKGGVGLIVSLGSADELFRTHKLGEVKVWRKINFRDLGQSTHAISDIALDGNRLVISSSSEWGRGGLWTYDIAKSKLAVVELFTARPEGVGIGAPDGKTLLTFDRTFLTPVWTKVAVPAAKK